MAIFHCNIKPICRSAGGSATSAAAYQSGTRIIDQRTGIVHNFKAKHGVVLSQLVLPFFCSSKPTQSEFWNGVELHHKRQRAVVARAMTIGLPAELSGDERSELAIAYATQIADEVGIGVDVAVHLPSEEGDQRNHHAHLLLSACSINQNGAFGKKAIQLDPISCARNGLPNFAVMIRAIFANLVNDRLWQHGHGIYVDHRTLIEQGIDREPTMHLGRAATNKKRHHMLSIRLMRINAIMEERKKQSYQNNLEVDETEDLDEDQDWNRPSS